MAPRSALAGSSGTEPAPTASEFPILLFAALKDAAQTGRITVRVHGGGVITVRELLNCCAQQYPQLARWLPHVRVAVNQEYSGAETAVRPGDEIALLPPVAGGANASSANASGTNASGAA